MRFQKGFGRTYLTEMKGDQGQSPRTSNTAQMYFRKYRIASEGAGGISAYQVGGCWCLGAALGEPGGPGWEDSAVPPPPSTSLVLLKPGQSTLACWDTPKTQPVLPWPVVRGCSRPAALLPCGGRVELGQSQVFFCVGEASFWACGSS